MKKGDVLKLIFAVVSCELAGFIGSIFTTPAIPTWYAGLVKPALTPPSWIFAPVWTALFAMMGVAVFLIWKKGLDKKGVKIALIIFDIQLVLNVFWSVIFFGLKSPGWAFVEIIFLWLAIVAVIIAFAKISRPTAWLLVPYIIWVSFAGYLNYSIWQLSIAPKMTQCTMEAKLCSDGSAVGRTGPNCEFAKCPDEIINLDDQTLIEKYFRQNIKTLAPEDPVLGGSWYVLDVEIDISKKTGVVTYEDGHIQGKASFRYSRIGDTITIEEIKKL